MKKSARYLLIALLAFALAVSVPVAPSQAGGNRTMTGAEAANFRAFINFWQEQDICWKRTVTRGVGAIPTECPGGEKNGLLCYPKCAAGYYGVGPVCWQSCPSGFRDDGALCTRDVKIIGADNSACPWYDKCGLTFARNCSKCPAGYINDGCTCRVNVQIIAKKSYGRTAGSGMSCGSNLDDDAGLCYSKCPAATTGIGPVCWGSCPADMPVNCGASCAKSSAACAESILNQVTSTGELALNVASFISGAGPAAKVGLTAARNTARATGKRLLSKEARQAAVDAIKRHLREQARREGKEMSDQALEYAAQALERAKEEGEFDWTTLDPTGVAEVVKAFYKPICGETLPAIFPR